MKDAYDCTKRGKEIFEKIAIHANHSYDKEKKCWKKEEIMEDLKKEIMDDDELDEVTGGVIRPRGLNVPKKFICSFCAQIFETKTELNKHVKSCKDKPTILNDNPKTIL